MLHELARTFAHSYNTTTEYNNTVHHIWGGLAGWFMVVLIFAVMLFCMWRIYARAGKPGWAVLVPFYNSYVMLKIVDRPGWWLVLYFVPIVNAVIGVIVYYELAKAFGRGVGTLLLMLFIPFVGFPVLAFSHGKYKKPVHDPKR